MAFAQCLVCCKRYDGLQLKYNSNGFMAAVSSLHLKFCLAMYDCNVDLIYFYLLYHTLNEFLQMYDTQLKNQIPHNITLFLAVSRTVSTKESTPNPAPMDLIKTPGIRSLVKCIWAAHRNRAQNPRSTSQTTSRPFHSQSGSRHLHVPQ
jgi:hypothetical protein